ncbi:MAG: hypothetical protein ACM3KR_03415 [Deltaproteobacteria bacterium]
MKRESLTLEMELGKDGKYKMKSLHEQPDFFKETSEIRKKDLKQFKLVAKVLFILLIAFILTALSYCLIGNIALLFTLILILAITGTSIYLIKLASQLNKNMWKAAEAQLERIKKQI